MSAPTSGVSVQDKHYILAWSLADEPKVNRYVDRLRNIHFLKSRYAKTRNKNIQAFLFPFKQEYTRLADVMIELVQKRHDDHHNFKAELGHDWLKVEPINNPSFEPDMVTMQGMNKLLRIYRGETTGTFKYLGRSTSASTPTPYSTSLQAEAGTRVNSETTGFHEIKGASIRTFGNLSSAVATSTIHQSGLFDATSSGTMLALHDFGGNGFNHVLNNDSFSFGMVIDFVPFGDY